MNLQHPTLEMLRQVAQGVSDRTTTLIVTAHAHFCTQCRDAIAAERDFYFDDMVASFPASIDQPLPAAELGILSNIHTQLPDQLPINKTEAPNEWHLPDEILDESPPPHQWEWQSFWPSQGKVARLASDAGGDYHLYLGYIEQGSALPSHVHHHEEQTLVLRGEYISAGQVFQPGQWASMEAGKTHSPAASDKGPCFCLIRAHGKGYKFLGRASWRNVFLPR